MRRSSAFLLSVVVFLCAGLPVASAKVSRQDRCAAYLLKATQLSIDCRIRKERRGILRKNRPDFDLCDDLLSRSVQRANRIFRGECPPIGEVETLAGLHADATETLVTAVTAPDFKPKKNYVMITFDDGLSAQRLKQLEPLLALRNPPDEGQTVGSPVRFTYFTTTIGTGYASVDYWHQKGHEVANHTVSHDESERSFRKLADQWSADGGASWSQELNEQDTIIDLWGGVSPSEVVGFRGPNLACNSYLFLDAFNAWSESKMTATNSIVYDSSMTIVPGPTNGFPPPFQSGDCEKTVKKYSNADTQGKLKICQSPPDEACIQDNYCFRTYWGLDDMTAQGFWEVPMPSLLKVDDKAVPAYYAAQSPSECNPECETQEQVEATFRHNFKLAQDKKTPMMIALHTDWLNIGATPTSNGDALIAWAKSVTDPTDLDNYDPDVRFVAVRDVVEMYAAKSEAAIKPPTVEPENCNYDYQAATDPATFCSGSLPSPDGTTSGADCNSQCPEGGAATPDYGLGPDGTACMKPVLYSTTTCNKTCGGPLVSQTGSDFTPGAAPWSGNPGGNCRTGNECGFYPVSTVPGDAALCTGP